MKIGTPFQRAVFRASSAFNARLIGDRRVNKIEFDVQPVRFVYLTVARRLPLSIHRSHHP